MILDSSPIAVPILSETGLFMRQKAEKKIREAAAALGPSDLYRIDEVRAKTDLVRKVFDKTLLDMAKLNTIELMGGETTGWLSTEIDNLVNHMGVQYMSFRFLDSTDAEPVPVIPELSGIEREQWLKFQYLCGKREGKDAVEKLCEMIDDYLKTNG